MDLLGLFGAEMLCGSRPMTGRRWGFCRGGSASAAFCEHMGYMGHFVRAGKLQLLCWLLAAGTEQRCGFKRDTCGFSPQSWFQLTAHL